jgi:hypothetical protein
LLFAYNTTRETHTARRDYDAAKGRVHNIIYMLLLSFSFRIFHRLRNINLYFNKGKWEKIIPDFITFSPFTHFFHSTLFPLVVCAAKDERASKDIPLRVARCCDFYLGRQKWKESN